MHAALHLTPNAQRLLHEQVWVVLFDLQSYLHPSWRVALNLPERASARSINHLLHIWLNERHAATHNSTAPISLLHGAVHDTQRRSVHTEPLIKCLRVWHKLESILYLLGAHACHTLLMSQGRLPFLRRRAASFISTPVARPGFSDDIRQTLQPDRIASDRAELDLDCPASRTSKAHPVDDLDKRIYRAGASILATACGPAHPILTNRLLLLLPFSVHDAFQHPLPVWRGNAQQAAFLIDLAHAFHNTSETHSPLDRRDIYVKDTHV